LKISPKAVVPGLIHDGKIINESNAIIEYLDEVFNSPALMPANPVDRATVRKWLIQLDAYLHTDIAFISFSIAFKHQILQTNNTPQKMEAFFAKIPNHNRANQIREMITKGLESSYTLSAILSYQKLLSDMENTLEKRAWLASDSISLADFAYAPYITRLEQLQLQNWWNNKPNISYWFSRICATKAYQEGIVKWNNPKYLNLMKTKGLELSPQISELVDAIQKKNLK
ncbi:MAG: glutathione S-transferase family protein, partial [Spongiibacteraceae bacterium]|nr:glutathione S-transferase family protein [Spongiibacteraceae bacterium]